MTRRNPKRPKTPPPEPEWLPPPLPDSLWDWIRDNATGKR